MSNTYRKYANKNHEEGSVASTQSRKHGLTKGAKRIKKAYNRAAKRREEKEAFREIF